MANLTKIILGLNILAASAGIFFGITKSGKTSELMDSVAIAKGEASKATGKLNKVESEIDTLTKQFTSKNQENVDLQGALANLERNTAGKATALADLKEQVAELEAKTNSLTTVAANLQKQANETRSAQEMVRVLQEERQRLQAALNTHLEGTRAPKKPKAPTVTAGGNVGKIANVDPRNGSIILNRGSAHGFKVGDQLNVFRNNKLIGRIEVTRLSGTNTGLSIAQRAEGLGVPAGAQFQVNDDLVKFQ